MSDISGTLAGLDALAERINEATRLIVSDGLHAFQKWAMTLAPVGNPENSTNASGDLKRSMVVEGPFGSDGTWFGRMGPTVTTRHPGPGGRIFNYGRQREFGGELHPNVSPYLVFKSFGVIYHKRTINQRGTLYLTRARVAAEPDLDAIVFERVAAAIEGG